MTEEEIKDLKHRISILEMNSQRTTQIFSALYQALQIVQSQPHYCSCGFDVQYGQKGQCSQEDCPHGLN